MDFTFCMYGPRGPITEGIQNDYPWAAQLRSSWKIRCTLREGERDNMGQIDILIVGDSIAGAYSPLVAEMLADRGFVVEQVYAGDSAAVLTGLAEWLDGKSPGLIQFNCGLHDARFFTYSQAYQQPINCYQVHLRGIVRWLKERTQARLLWASTTPVITERITLDYLRFPKDILAYNAVAQMVMHEAGIPINDLHGALTAASISDCISADGVHMTGRGNSVLAEAVADGILTYLHRSPAH